MRRPQPGKHPDDRLGCHDDVLALPVPIVSGDVERLRQLDQSLVVLCRCVELRHAAILAFRLQAWTSDARCSSSATPKPRTARPGSPDKVRRLTPDGERHATAVGDHPRDLGIAVGDRAAARAHYAHGRRSTCCGLMISMLRLR